MLKITDLPINVEKTFGKLKYGGENQGFVNLRAENIPGNYLIKVKPVDPFMSDDFNFMDDVKLINPMIVASEVGNTGRNNSGVLQAKIVPVDSDEQTIWASEPTGGSDIEVTLGGREFEIPVKHYIGSKLQFVGVSIGYSQGRSTQRQNAIRNGDSLDGLGEDVVKLSVFDAEKKQNLSIDLPLSTLGAIENDFQMGESIKFINLRIRFFMPEQGNYAHVLTADNLIKQASNSNSGKPKEEKPQSQDANKQK
ncbi:hypothetical protein D3P96_03635 [Weissella viridescens]|uniref:Uncharacterized protein n=1 Tax=Weissella viridescens TaxID=1629 RepID=A0A3P2RCL3_WEIVI|nr:hypothetical protein [Weissella viridescens]RRG18387.1 hypothetical protein D3P96_03635 [Weissella viridescens]